MAVVVVVKGEGGFMEALRSNSTTFRSLQTMKTFHPTKETCHYAQQGPAPDGNKVQEFSE